MTALSPLSQEYITHMTEDEWRDLYKRLRLFSYKHYGWLHTKIEGLDLESLIQDAIEDTLFGIRQWPVIGEDGEIKNVSLCIFLCQTIRSKVSHIVEHEKNKVHIDALDDHLVRLTSNISLRDMRANEGSDEMAIYNEIGQQLLERVHEDELLTRIVKLYLDTPDLRPREVAEQLGLPIKEIQKARRRLHQIIVKLREEQNNG
jgi:predicted XRE-type DNA-binding protein